MVGPPPSARWMVPALVALLLGSSLAAVAVAVPGAPSIDRAANPSAVTVPSALDGPSAPPAGPRPSAGEGSVLSTIDLVDNRTLPGANQPATQDTPESVVYDPVNGDLYVRGDPGTSLTVVDGADDSVLQEIAIPPSQNDYSEAVTMAVDPATGALYTTNAQSSNLSIVSSTSNTLLGTVTVGGAPNGIVYDPTNGFLYVTEWAAPKVAVVNPASDSLVTSIDVGTEPGAILFDPISDRVIVANYGSDNVSILNPSTETLVATVVAGAHPNALALDTDDDLVDVANSESSPGTVTVVPPADPSSAYNLSTGLFPAALAYVPVADELFVGNSASGNVTILNQSTRLAVANPRTGSAPQAEAFDAASGDVYVENAESYNVSVLNVSTNTLVASVALDNSYDYGLAVDGATGDLFAVSEGSYSLSGEPPHAQANATVIDPATNTAIASIPLNVYPVAPTYDPVANLLIVVDRGGNDAYLLDPSTDAIVDVVPVGLLPQDVAVDTTTGALAFVADGLDFPYEGGVTFLTSAFAFAKNLTTGYDPSGIAFDPSNGYFYVPDELGSNVTVLDGADDQVVTVIQDPTTAEFVSVAYDPHSDEVYVGDQSNGTVAVIDPAAEQIVAWVAAGSEPVSIVSDPTNDTLFVANEGSDSVTVIADATNTVATTVTLSYASALAYDSANDLVYNADNFAGDVDAFNASTYALEAVPIALGTSTYPHGIGFDPANGELYVSSEYQGSVSVLGNPGAALYPVTFTEAGLPAGTEWSVTLNETVQVTQGTEILFSEPNALYQFSVGLVPGYRANVTVGTVSVYDGPAAVLLQFTPFNFSVTFSETGLPSGTDWSVTVNGALNSSTHATIGFRETNGTWGFTVGAVSRYAANVTSGTFVVDNASVAEAIAFAYAPGDVAYPVTFDEVGLPAATPWSIDFNGSTVNSTHASIGFESFNGSAPFSVGPVSGYRPNVTGGSVDVAGGPVLVRIQFTATSGGTAYTITFKETGLAPFTRWNVSIERLVEAIGTGEEHNLSAPNGSYTFFVGNVSGYSVSPASGPLVVNGAPFTVTLTFTSLNAPPSSASSPASGTPTWEWAALGAAIGVAALVLVFLVARRKKRTAVPASSPGSEASTPPAS